MFETKNYLNSLLSNAKIKERGYLPQRNVNIHILDSYHVTL